MESWNEIVRTHGPPTYRAAWRILRHAQDCEDVVQEVFLQAYKPFLLGEIAHPKTFFNRVVTFRAIEMLRKRRRIESINSVLPLDESPSVETAVIHREEESRLRSIVAELPPRQAAVFCLIHFEELSHDEVAATLEISGDAVAMALHKARAKLREVFAVVKKDAEQ